MKKLLVLLTLLCSLTAWANQDNANPNEGSMEEVYHNKAIIVDRQHSTFTIRLPANPTTGYSWLLKDYDAKLLKPVKQHFVAATDKRVGAAGTNTWTFSAKSTAFTVPRFTQISFVYAQPWNLESASDNIFTVVLH